MLDYSVSLPHGRTLAISEERLRLIATGLGEHRSALGAIDEEREPRAIVEAINRLPLEHRATALNLVMLKFGEKRDLESISHALGLSAWEVWQREAAFRTELGYTPAPGHNGAASDPVQAKLSSELEESDTARVMSAEMLSNAIAHGETVDLEVEHESSLQAVHESRS